MAEAIKQQTTLEESQADFVQAETVAEAPIEQEPTAEGEKAEQKGWPDPKGRQDPIFPGASIGIPGKGGGTLGMKVIDNRSGRPMLLTAGLSLGNVTARQNQAEISWQAGTPVLQPGPHDGGTITDKIGEVARVVLNDVCDGGVAFLTGERELSDRFPDGTVVSGITAPVIGMEVWKYGSGTGYTAGRIAQIGSVRMHYGSGEMWIHDLFVTGRLTAGGDGGAIVLEAGTNRAVGMVIGGSDAHTVCVPIHTLIKELDIRVAGYEEEALEALTAVNDAVGVRAPDRLGYNTYIDAFVRLVRDPNTQPPLTIGIYGAWGSGKTFLMTRMMERLQGMAAIEPEDIERPPRWWNRLWWRIRTTEVSPQFILTAILVILTVPIWGPLLLLLLLLFQLSEGWSWLREWAGTPLSERFRTWGERLGQWFRASVLGRFRTWGERLGQWFRSPLPPLGTFFAGDTDEQRLADVAVVPFNAWEYQASEKLWAGLVQKIFAAIEAQLGTYGRFTINFQRNLKREATRLRHKLLPYTLIVGTVLGMLIVGLLALGQEGLALLVPVLGIPGLVRLGVEMASILRTPQSERIVSFFAQPDYSQHLGLMADIRRDLEALIEGLPKDLKIAVFVDDLDRCSPEKAVEVLEAIKLLLDFDRFIVFLGIDARIITHAVEEHYGETFAKAGVSGYEYLHKIVQIPFNIPEPSPEDIRLYLNSLLGAPYRFEGDILEPHVEAASAPQPTGAPLSSEREPEPPEVDVGPALEEEGPSMVEPTEVVKQEVVALPEQEEVVRKGVPFLKVERDAFRTFIPYMVPNPRRIKRLVNVYRLMRDLAPAKGLTDIRTHLGRIIPWLLLTEQWAYTAHLMLDCLDSDDEAQYANLQALYQAVQALPKKDTVRLSAALDADPDLLDRLMRDYGAKITRDDIDRFRGLTINFNPALRSEIEAALGMASDEAKSDGPPPPWVLMRTAWMG